jgi:predicted DsbA family dithiol-disulfide isomerase
MGSRRPELKITVFSDFICPFCYIGHRRVEHLRDAYDLKINWRFLEIQPETPVDGGSFSDYGIPDARRKMLDTALAEMAGEEGLKFCSRERVSNSNKALRLAEAAKREGADVFYPLCESLFRSYFAEGQDIGDEAVLRRLAREAGMAEESLDAVWREEQLQVMLTQNLRSAIELGVTGTPTFFFGETRLTGAVPVESLRAAARTQVGQGDSSEG